MHLFIYLFYFGDLVEVGGEVPHVVHAIARQRLGGRHHGQSGHVLQQLRSSLNKYSGRFKNRYRYL